MQTKTCLALFGTIVVLLIGTNHGAPTAPEKAAVVAPAPPVTEKPIRRPGGRTAWSAKIDARSKKLFNTHVNIISKKLQEIHKVDKKFHPKPAKAASQMVSGVLHHYLVELPTKKYAYVTILSQAWKKQKSLNEKHVTVRPQLYELNDQNV